MIRRTMFDIVQNCEKATVDSNASSETGASSLDDTRSGPFCCSPRPREEDRGRRAEGNDKGSGIDIHFTAVEVLREEGTPPEPEPEPACRTRRYKMSRVVKSRLPTTTGMRRTLRNAASKLNSLVSASHQEQDCHCRATARGAPWGLRPRT